MNRGDPAPSEVLFPELKKRLAREAPTIFSTFANWAMELVVVEERIRPKMRIFSRIIFF